MASHSDDTVNAQIIEDARNALAGAESLRARLLAGLSFYRYRDQGFLENAYFIKTRVKDFEHLVEKVHEKRANDKPHYRVTDVTDILGLRILVLWRDDLAPKVLEVVRFIKFAQGDPFAFFDGSFLRDGIKELIIYEPPGDSSISDAVCHALLNDTELGSQFCIPNTSITGNSEVIPILIERKPSSYSSVHIVAWCRPLITDSKFRTPLEIQIRHPLEDYWSEVEWVVKYKRRLFRELGQRETGTNAVANGLLRELKSQLDSCSRQSQIIYNDVFSPKGDAIPSQVIFTLPVPDLDLDDKLLKQVSSANKRLITILDGVEAGSFSETTNVVADLQVLSKEFRGILQLYKSSPVTDPQKDKYIQFYLPMQQALCLYWRSYLINNLSDDPDIINSYGHDERIFEDSWSIYVELSKDIEYRDDPRLAYAIGTIFAVRGELGYARGQYIEALKKLRTTDKVPADDIIRLLIPRMLAMTLWKEAKMTEERARHINDDNFMKEKRRAQYLEALRLTAQNYDEQVKMKQGERQYIGQHVEGAFSFSRCVPIENYMMRSLNNLLTYAMDYFDVGGTVEDTEREVGLSSERIKEVIKEISLGDVGRIDRPACADTIRATAKYIGDDGLVKAAAARVLELLKDEKKWLMYYGKEGVDYMKREAERDLQAPNSST